MHKSGEPAEKKFFFFANSLMCLLEGGRGPEHHTKIVGAVARPDGVIGAEIFPWRIKFGLAWWGWGVGYCAAV